MKTLTLTKQQARHLVMSLEASGKGFNIGQLRKLNSVLDKLSEPIGTFSGEIERIARSCTDDDERDHILEALTNTDGQDPVTIEMEDADYELLKEQWSGLQFSPNRFARTIVLGIDDAMKAAELAPLADRFLAEKV